jgi:hypothetical protein
VNTFGVVVADVFTEESAQVILIKHDDVIDDVSFARSLSLPKTPSEDFSSTEIQKPGLPE